MPHRTRKMTPKNKMSRNIKMINIRAKINKMKNRKKILKKY